MTLNIYRNVAIPFTGPIGGGLRHDQQILVTGTPEGPKPRFSINLICGPGENPTNAFHFNPRFDQGQVVRNTRIGGLWGSEEKHGSFPFQKNCRFDIAILVLPNTYRVSVNGQHYCDFNHRIAVNQVTHIRVRGGVRVDSIRIDLPPMCVYPGAEKPPMYTPAPPPLYPEPAKQLAPMYNPAVPFVQNIGGLYPGRMIFISGIPRLNSQRFNINFLAGGDNAFVFDVRFKFGGDRNVLVRNTQTYNQWGREERDMPYFPFVEEAYFDMIVLVEPGCFKVALNNNHLLQYNHRIQPLNRIDTLRIDGDVKLCLIRFQ